MNKVSVEKVSIIIPVFNSSKTISLLVDEILKEIKIYKELEIVLVNDGSSLDNSSEVCESIAYKNPTVKFINLSRNFGYHNAVLAGLNFCTGDCAVIIDDDFQNPPKEVCKLVEEIENGNDVVFSKYLYKKHHFLRNLGSKFNNLIASFLLDKPRDLYLSSSKAINRFVIDEIVKYKGPYAYIDGLILRITQKFVSVTVNHESRTFGKSNYTIRKLISIWLDMFTNFSIVPLRLATGLGFIFSVIGVVLALVFFIQKINNPDIPIGWASLAVSIFLLGSLQLFAIGMVGEYLGRMFLSTGGKPQFVVRSLINCTQDKESEK